MVAFVGSVFGSTYPVSSFMIRTNPIHIHTTSHAFIAWYASQICHGRRNERIEFVSRASYSLRCMIADFDAVALVIKIGTIHSRRLLYKRWRIHAGYMTQIYSLSPTHAASPRYAHIVSYRPHPNAKGPVPTPRWRQKPSKTGPQCAPDPLYKSQPEFPTRASQKCCHYIPDSHHLCGST